MPYPVLPEDFAGRASLLQRIGDVIQGPWGRQSVESGVPIAPLAGQPGGMSPPPPVIPLRRLPTDQQISRGLDEAFAKGQGQPETPGLQNFAQGLHQQVQQRVAERGTDLSRMMKEEPMWTKWGQDMKIPVDRLLKAVPALRQNWNLSDSQIKYYFTLMKQRGEL